MLKKMKADVSHAPASGDKDASSSVLESSRQIWLAGLGAFSRAQAEGMKVFESLVQQGEALESRTKKAAFDTAAAATGAAKARAKEVQAMAGGTWDKLEKVFEDRVARALSRLGVHTQSDVDRLAARVDALAEAVNQLIKASGGKPVRTIAGKTAKRTVRTAAGKTAKRTVRTAKKVARSALE